MDPWKKRFLSFVKEPRKWLGWLLAPLLWLGLATLAWLLLLSVATLVSEGPALLLTPSSLTYLAALALRYTLVASALLGGLHLVCVVLGRWPRLRVAASTVLVVGAGALPAWEQATFLTSGDGISSHSQVAAIRVGILVGLLVGVALVWLWHYRGTWASEARRKGLSLLLACSWLGVGLAGAAVLFHLINDRLQTYAFFASSLVGPLWLLVGTLLFRALLRPKKAALAIAAVAAALATCCAASPGPAARWREQGRDPVVDGVVLASLTDMAIQSEGRPSARFDISDPARFRCRTGDEGAARLPRPQGVDLPEEPSLLIITVDALREDALDWSFKGRAVTPNIRALREKFVEFTNASTPYPATLFALGGAVTGLLPSDIFFAPTLPDNVLKQTAHLFDQRTIVFPTSGWFKMPIIDSLIVQGTPVLRYRNARQQTDHLITQLRRARQSKKNVFAWIHYLEPHPSYRAHKGFRFGRSKKALYMSELAYSDHQLGRLMAYLEQDRWLDDSLVLVFADHGQAVGERRYYGHHVYLNRWIIDVPLFLHAPGRGAEVVDDVVSLIDVAPTILHFFDLPVPQTGLAKSLLLDASQKQGDRFAIAEAFPIRGRELFKTGAEPIQDLDGLAARLEQVHTLGRRNYSPRVSVVTKSHRLIVNRATGVATLYDRRADPAEAKSLSASEPETLAELDELLRGWHESQSERMYCRVRATKQ